MMTEAGWRVRHSRNENTKFSLGVSDKEGQ